MKTQFSWQYYYYTLTPEGLDYLREWLHLPAEIVPATHIKQQRSHAPPRGMMGDEGGRRHPLVLALVTVATAVVRRRARRAPLASSLLPSVVVSVVAVVLLLRKVFSSDRLAMALRDASTCGGRLLV